MNQKEEDIILLTNLIKGDETAFDHIFKKYYLTLCTYGNRFVDLEDAEEIAQDVMIWLWENRENQIIKTSLLRYMLRMVYTKAMNKIKRNELKAKHQNLYFDRISDIIFSETDIYEFQDFKERIFKAINLLPKDYKTVFILHRFKGLTYKEIANLLNISPKTVDYRIQQSLKLLTIKLKDLLLIAFIIFYI